MKLGEELGYYPIAATRCNLFLTRSSLLDAVLPAPPNLRTLNPSGNEGHYIFTGFDEALLSNRSSVDRPWHGIKTPDAKTPSPASVFSKVSRRLQPYSALAISCLCVCLLSGQIAAARRKNKVAGRVD